MNLNQLNNGVCHNHQSEQQLLLASPEKIENKKQEEIKKETLKDNNIGNFYNVNTSKSELTKEVNHYKAGNTTPYNGGYSSSNYSNRGYGSNSSNNSKVGLYGGANLNYNDRINAIRKKSKEIAKQETNSTTTIPFEGKYDFTVRKGKVKKKNKFFKGKAGKLIKQIGVAVATICLEVALGSLISTAKLSVEKIADEVKNAITGNGGIISA